MIDVSTDHLTPSSKNNCAKHVDPYRFENVCNTSNVPLLSFLYGSKNEGQHGPSVNAAQPRRLSPLRSSRPDLADWRSFGEPYYTLSSGTGGIPIPPFDEEVPRTPCEVKHELRERPSEGVLKESVREGTVMVATESFKDEPEREEGAPGQVPFHLKLKEVRRRISEQLHVHQELGQASREIDRVADEVRIFRSTQNTAAFLTRINQSRIATFDIQDSSSPLSTSTQKKVDTVAEPTTTNRYNSIFSVTSNASHDNFSAATTSQAGKPSAPQTPTNPFLAEVLNNFTKNNPTIQSSMAAKAQKKRREEIMANTIRPPASPTPYRRVVLVPVAPRNERKVVDTPIDLGRTEGNGDEVTHQLHTSEIINQKDIQKEESYTGDFDMEFSGISVIHSSPDAGNTSVEDEVEDLREANQNEITQIASASSLPTSETPHSSLSHRRTVTASDASTESMSVGESIASEYSSDSTVSISSSAIQTATRSSSSITSEVEDEINEELPERVGIKDEMRNNNAVSASAVLKEFLVTCKRANDLAMQISTTGKGSYDKLNLSMKRSSETVRKENSVLTPGVQDVDVSIEIANKESDSSEQRAVDNQVPPSASHPAPEEWLASMKVDVKDIKRLSRFTQHLQQQLKSMDAQRKIRAVKKHALEKAQKLSRARKKMHENPKKRLKAILREEQESNDAIEDLLEDFAEAADEDGGNSGGDIADELESLLYEQDSWGGGSGDGEVSIEEDFAFSGNESDMSADGDIDDEIEDAFEDDAEDNDQLSDEVVDEMADIDALSDEVQELDHSILDEMEDEFADRLVDISNVSDVMDEIDLPVYSDIEDEIDERKKGGQRMKRENSLDTNSDIIDEVDGTAPAGSVPGSPVSTVSASSVASEDNNSTEEIAESMSSHSWDADVDTIIPNSSSTSEYPSRASINSSFSDATHNSLERDFFWTEDRRKKALRRGPNGKCPTFTQLYDPLVSSESSSESSRSSSSSSSTGSTASSSQPNAAFHTRTSASCIPTTHSLTSSPLAIPIVQAESGSSNALSAVPSNAKDIYTSDKQGSSKANKAVQEIPVHSSTTNAQGGDVCMKTESIDDRPLDNTENGYSTFDNVFENSSHYPAVLPEKVKRAAADFVALDQWKSQQKKLFRELLFPLSVPASQRTTRSDSELTSASSYRTSSDEESKAPGKSSPSARRLSRPKVIARRSSTSEVVKKKSINTTELSGPQKERAISPTGSFSYHWGMLESMLHCRFENPVAEDHPLETFASPLSCGFSSSLSCGSDGYSSVYA